MKTYHRIFIAMIILVLAFASIAAAPAKKKNTSSWAGLWQATDQLDGSKIQVSIAPQGQIMYTDKVYAGCGGGSVKGTGGSHPTGGSLVTGLKLKCASNGVVIASNYSLSFSHTSPITLVDSNGNRYVLVKPARCGR